MPGNRLHALFQSTTLSTTQSLNLLAGMDLSYLLQDLYSPPTVQLSPRTPSLIALHLSHATPAGITALIRALVSSPSLWAGRAAMPEREIAAERATDVFGAVREGCSRRAEETAKELGTGWRGRSGYAAFVTAICEGLTGSEEGQHPLPALIVASALVAGVGDIKARKDKLYVGGRAIKGVAESQLVAQWTTALERGLNPRDRTTGAWLASMTVPGMAPEALQLLASRSLVHLLSAEFSSFFHNGHLFRDLSDDVTVTESSKKHWNVPSPSFSRLSTTSSSTLFQSLGPFSRALGKSVEAASLLAGRSEVHEEVVRSIRGCVDALEQVSKRMREDWGRCEAWSDAEDGDFDASTSALEVHPWAVLKKFLFSLTLILSSYVVILSPPSSSSQPPSPLQAQLAAQCLRILQNTFFIAVRFGPDGFPAWRGVRDGCVDVVVAAAEAEAGEAGEEAKGVLLGLRLPAIDGPTKRKAALADTIFYLDLSEQLLPHLPSSYISGTLLPACRPYLEGEEGGSREAFESAHSVLLAVMRAEKAGAEELAVWYTSFLLEQPDRMTTPQLRLAFTTVTRYLSSIDDAQAWHAITQLVEKLERLPAREPPIEVGKIGAATASTSGVKEQEDGRMDEAAQLSPDEAMVVRSLARGELLLVLIDQLTSVNLILFQTLLDRIASFIREEQRGKEELGRILFGVLGKGLDGTKRERGVGWWLEERDGLLVQSSQ